MRKLAMRRYHLFEFLDQAWLPEQLRAAMTRYLSAACGTTPFPALWAAVIARVLGECGADHIVDIGSGSGGPMKLVLADLARLGKRPHVTLTDLYPVPTDSTIEYWPAPVRANCVPAKLQGLRTLFLCLHHFAPAEAREVLKDAFNQRQPICIFEATSRTAPAIRIALDSSSCSRLHAVNSASLRLSTVVHLSDPGDTAVSFLGRLCVQPANLFVDGIARTYIRVRRTGLSMGVLFG